MFFLGSFVGVCVLTSYLMCLIQPFHAWSIGRGRFSRFLAKKKIVFFVFLLSEGARISPQHLNCYEIELSSLETKNLHHVPVLSFSSSLGLILPYLKCYDAEKCEKKCEKKHPTPKKMWKPPPTQKKTEKSRKKVEVKIRLINNPKKINLKL